MSALSDLIKAAKLRKLESEKQTQQSERSELPLQLQPQNQQETQPENQTSHAGIDRYGNSIQWNAEQWQFIETASSGESCILIGAAGTGKTTCMKGAIQNILQTRYIPPLNDTTHKHLPSQTPGIIAISYTRRAVMNLRKAMPEDLKANCITIHKLLEYQPVFYEVQDETTGEYKKTMKFEPARNQYNPLSSSIKTIIIDESSMVSVDLFHKIWIALPNPSAVQFIFLGDIQQLPPVFGSAILGFKMTKLKTVELVQVYRQALESPIIRLAHRILSGNPIPDTEFPEWHFQDQLKLHPWKKKISSESALLTLAGFFKKGYDSGAYDPSEDMILVPYNLACGTDELNRHIGNHIAKSKKNTVYEVIAGFNKHYFQIGEKILYEKEDAEIISIKRNYEYLGKAPQPPSVNLDYWGCLQEDTSQELDHHLEDAESADDIDIMLDKLSDDKEERVRAASHILTVRLKDSDREIEIKTASEINALILAYSLTGHKSQGSEWKKVFVCIHQSHSTLVQREWLYTAITRAREELYVICEPDTFVRGIKNQRIKGNTLAEKSMYFTGKLALGEDSILQEIL